MKTQDALLSRVQDYSGEELKLYDDLMGMDKADVVKACISRERKLNRVLDLVCQHATPLYVKALEVL